VRVQLLLPLLPLCAALPPLPPLLQPSSAQRVIKNAVFSALPLHRSLCAFGEA
jgi:hypothetical protein